VLTCTEVKTEKEATGERCQKWTH